MAALATLTTQGRAVGYSVVAALQDPRKDVLTIRNLFPDRIAMRLDEPEQVDMVLGDGARDRGAACELISTDPATGAGVAFIRVEADPDPVRVRAGWVTDADIRDMAAGCLDDLAAAGDRGGAGMSVFYLGAHQPHWLWRAAFPLFVSHRAAHPPPPPLRPASCRWALDSGGFTELSLHGRWITPPEDYAAAVTRYAEQIGGLDFAAPQDWMCEPFMLARTGLSVAEHQHRTVANYLALRQLAPALPFIPVVQGWRLADYLACVDLYASAGVDLAALPRVGLGSVCRRQSTAEIAVIVTALAAPRAAAARVRRSRPAACTCTGTCWPRPTRWPGATPPAAPRPCPAAPGTATAPTA